jgi:hypothetical protein
MARENVENWHVRKCAKACEKCEKVFRDKEALYSSLFFEEGEYVRKDVCEECWSKDDTSLSSWKTVFIVPPPPQEEAVKKENAESLLRKLLAKENEEDLSAIFILTVMLERKKILVERDVQSTEDGQKLRVYEHKKTGESFMVTDPQLKLDKLAEVQEQVVALLSGQPSSVVDEPVLPLANRSDAATAVRRPKLWKRYTKYRSPTSGGGGFESHLGRGAKVFNHSCPTIIAGTSIVICSRSDAPSAY